MKSDVLQERLKGGTAQVVDVRTGAEWRSGHIGEALHLPLDVILGGQLPDVPADGREMVIVCQSGVRAAKAQTFLQEKGIGADVLDGGMNAWAEAGLPQAKEANAVSLVRQVQMIVGLLNILGVVLGLGVSLWWLVIPVFAGAGLLIAGVTGTCGLALLLARLPWNR